MECGCVRDVCLMYVHVGMMTDINDDVDELEMSLDSHDCVLCLCICYWAILGT